MSVQQGEIMATETKLARIEVRATQAQRELIVRAVEAEGSDLTSFVLGYAVEAALRVLADRHSFVLDDDASREWERINNEPPQYVEGLRELLMRPSPFTA